MKTDSRIGTVVVDIATVRDVISLYKSRCKWDRASIDALEALSHTFIDTVIGEEVASIWYKARGGRR